MKILVTGGAGYIGTTTAIALEEAGHTPIILDSLVTGVETFTRGRLFYRGDIADSALLQRIFSDHPDIFATIHMAALVVVPESVARPSEYYRNNFIKSLALFEELARLGKPRIVFSSSASIYAPIQGLEVREGDPLAPTSPYASSKWMVEQILNDLAAAGDVSAISLRYFNPIGTEPGLRAGVHVREPSHVLGQLVRAARGQSPEFRLTGTDFPTRDGTGIRDYIHVWDLARAHVRTVEQYDSVLATEGSSNTTINLGTGAGVTVRELVKVFEQIYGRQVPLVETSARPGDVAGAFANVDKARRLLGWHSELQLADGIESALAWAERRKEVLGYD